MMAGARRPCPSSPIPPRWRYGVLCLVLFLVGFSGCAGQIRGALGGGPGPCPIVLVSTADLANPLALRARMHLVANGREIRLEVVARGTGDELVVVGVAGYGVRLFVVSQHGRAFSVEASSSALERVALWVLDALHRAYWVRPPPSAEPGELGSRWVQGAERVTESRRGGTRRREFALDGAAPDSARVTIDYPGDAGDGDGHEAEADRTVGRAEIENPWCGYTAVVAPLATSRPTAGLGVDADEELDPGLRRRGSH